MSGATERATHRDAAAAVLLPTDAKLLYLPAKDLVARDAYSPRIISTRVYRHSRGARVITFYHSRTFVSYIRVEGIGTPHIR